MALFLLKKSEIEMFHFCSQKCGNFKGYPVPPVLKGTEQKQAVEST